MSEINDKLNKPIPRSAIQEREGPGGRSLSYVTGYFVSAGMNEVFGNMGWGYIVDSLEVVSEELDGGKWRVCYRARVTVRVVGESNYGSSREDVGYGHGIDRDKGKAHESAGKEAVTDARKRASATFGNYVGLALYDKEQTFISDEEAPAASPAKKGRKPAAKKAEPLLDVVSEFSISEQKFLTETIEGARTVEDLEPARNLLNTNKTATNRGKFVESFLAKKTELQEKQA